jgi:hypothetical protein
MKIKIEEKYFPLIMAILATALAVIILECMI